MVLTYNSLRSRYSLFRLGDRRLIIIIKLNLNRNSSLDKKRFANLYIMLILIKLKGRQLKGFQAVGVIAEVEGEVALVDLMIKRLLLRLYT